MPRRAPLGSWLRIRRESQVQTILNSRAGSSTSTPRRARASVPAMERTSLLIVALWSVLGLCACAAKSGAGSTSAIGSGIDIETMRPPDAARVISEFQTKYGVTPIPTRTRPVTSMAEALDIVRGDRFPEFQQAREFMAGKQGPEALSVRSYLETSGAGAFLLAAAILEEERRRDLTELRQITQSRPLENREDGISDQDRAEGLRAKNVDLRKVIRALNVLSEAPLMSGANLAEQAVRQDPQSQLAYLANANYYRIRERWLEFDRMMGYADNTEGGENRALKTYLRAMEALVRYTDPAKCKALLEASLAQSPGFVRAQANLVLVERAVEDSYAQLQKLREMNPQHIVVSLAGPMIEREYFAAVEFENARRN